ncbi:hypothetical protein ARMSODRAFT_1025321 [Armillaria solidipes]|uniref:Heterokaryon incompatibility domain-containing protein n=1 Tax=Armillaria solidipes TaxID=1076256 RepID=A0A2H3BD56_9AGAR|nr:hypothetical protein ARMSODRAFT_1025321 [Armillaria solidipes]
MKMQDCTAGSFEQGQIIEARQQYELRLPEATISSFTETGQAESTVPVLKQRIHTSRRPIIPSSLTNTPCSALGVALMLQNLNKNTDSGTAFAYLRLRWYGDLSIIEDELRTWEALDIEMRESDQLDDRILSRRIWDLFSNRVVPCVWTAINGYTWPVPIPRGVDLHLLRIELLELGAEFAWVDVLCLRQLGGLQEDLHELEWSIGPLVYYFNGLGRPMGRRVDLESRRSWFQRAWTLQEMSVDYLIGGETSEGVEGGYREELVALRHINRTPDVPNHVCSLSASLLLNILKEMQTRVSTNPRDKVAGLSYLFLLRCIPAYSPSQNEEDVWSVIVREMDLRVRGQLFFLYPRPDRGTRQWWPSWEQVMSEDLQVVEGGEDEVWMDWIKRGEDGRDLYWGYHIESGYVRGLENSSFSSVRQGELVVTDVHGGSHTISIIASHQDGIPAGVFTLLGTSGHSSPDIEFFVEGTLLKYWIAGRVVEGRFEKISVFQVADEEERKRLIGLGVDGNRTISLW